MPVGTPSLLVFFFLLSFKTFDWTLKVDFLEAYRLVLPDDGAPAGAAGGAALLLWEVERPHAGEVHDAPKQDSGQVLGESGKEAIFC